MTRILVALATFSLLAVVAAPLPASSATESPEQFVERTSNDVLGILRDSGLGVILISHNMADVQAVADRIVVLRLGRNAAEFSVEEATTDQLVAAITGASDNVVAARQQRAKGEHRG